MSQKKNEDSLKEIVSLCKRRGFIYPGSEIYGGFANTYSYGPYGTEMKRNIKDLFWQTFVQKRPDMVGIDGPILLHPEVWAASGHLESFSDLLIDCKNCKARLRVDHLIEEQQKIDVEGKGIEEIEKILQEHPLICPKCGKQEFTPPRHFNLMFATSMNKVDNDKKNLAYLRPETAQAIFIEYKNIIDTMRVRIPFGIAQIGKAFRNEITPGNFVFRLIEFEQMEIEYFIREKDWEKTFSDWLESMHQFSQYLGLPSSMVHESEHSKEKLSHYSKKTIDITFDFPFGRSELWGLAYRTDFDLKQHQEHTKTNMQYIDPITKERYIPHVIEPTFGVDRTLLALLCAAYDEEELETGKRVVLRLHPRVAPVKMAIFPLMNKEPLSKKAKEIFSSLNSLWNIEYDESGAIGKRYRRHDEIGTPYCVTVDFDTLEDNTVTLRERDSMQQVRIPIDQLQEKLNNLLL